MSLFVPLLVATLGALSALTAVCFEVWLVDDAGPAADLPASSRVQARAVLGGRFRYVANLLASLVETR